MNEKKLDRSDDTWPALPLEAWKDTYATLRMYTQIAGNVRRRARPDDLRHPGGEGARRASSYIRRNFLQSTYDAGADLARWDRGSLERAPG